MSRYIDADEAKRIFLNCAAQQLRLDRIEDARAMKQAADCLDSIPTADVAPVVHGHWIPKKEILRSPDAKNYNCSVCGKESFAYPNCPYCRSVMDEEEKKYV